MVWKVPVWMLVLSWGRGAAFSQIKLAQKRLLAESKRDAVQVGHWSLQLRLSPVLFRRGDQEERRKRDAGGGCLANRAGSHVTWAWPLRRDGPLPVG